MRDELRVGRKGGRREALAINPQTAARVKVYLEAAGHAEIWTARCSAHQERSKAIVA
jgi:hypothetical protein